MASAGHGGTGVARWCHLASWRRHISEKPQHCSSPSLSTPSAHIAHAFLSMMRGKEIRAPRRAQRKRFIAM
jgi:hypothetical protein